MHFVYDDERAIREKILKWLFFNLFICKFFMFYLQFRNAVDEQWTFFLYAVFVGKVGLAFVCHQHINNRCSFSATRYASL
nr:MAG TPA: hypothetical protein [Inoviridae sp.]